MATLNEAILLAAKLFGILFSSIALHELAHYLYFRKVLKIDVKIRIRYRRPLKIWLETGNKWQYETLTDKEYILVNLGG